MPTAQLAAADPDARRVLSVAVVRAAERLGLTQAALAALLGISRPSASRLVAGSYRLSPERGKEWELGALFVRLYRSLLAIVGSDEAASAWLHGENSDLGAPPAQLLGSAQGLLRVVQYVDAHRGVV